MNKQAVLDLLRGDGSIVVNKRLAKAIGLQEAVAYSELVSKYKYWAERGELTEGEWFYCTNDNLSKDTAIGEVTLRKKIIPRLKKLELVEVEMKGMPGKKHYRITDKIFEILGIVPTKGGQNDQPSDDGVPEENNGSEDRHEKGGQNDQPRVVKEANQGWSDLPPNNTRTNNPEFNNPNQESINNTNSNNSLSQGSSEREEKPEEKSIGLDKILNSTLDERLKKVVQYYVHDLELNNVDLVKLYKFMMKHRSKVAVKDLYAVVVGLAEQIDEVGNTAALATTLLSHADTILSRLTKTEFRKVLEDRENQPETQDEERDKSIYYNWLEEE